MSDEEKIEIDFRRKETEAGWTRVVDKFGLKRAQSDLAGFRGYTSEGSFTASTSRDSPAHGTSAANNIPSAFRSYRAALLVVGDNDCP